MYVIDIWRRAREGLILRALGTSPNHPRLTTEQQKAQGFHAEIRAYPSKYVTKAQDLDPSSATFGQIYFIPGIHEPGAPNPLGPP